jgi:hypothetical protein
MTNFLQKLMFWRHDDKPEAPAAVPEQRPNRWVDSQGNPTPEALDEKQSREQRGEFVDEHVRKREEEDDSPRPDYEP